MPATIFYVWRCVSEDDRTERRNLYVTARVVGVVPTRTE